MDLTLFLLYNLLYFFKFILYFRHFSKKNVKSDTFNYKIVTKILLKVLSNRVNDKYSRSTRPWKTISKLNWKCNWQLCTHFLWVQHWGSISAAAGAKYVTQRGHGIIGTRTGFFFFFLQSFLASERLFSIIKWSHSRRWFVKCNYVGYNGSGSVSFNDHLTSRLMNWERLEGYFQVLRIFSLDLLFLFSLIFSSWLNNLMNSFTRKLFHS